MTLLASPLPSPFDNTDVIGCESVKSGKNSQEKVKETAVTALNLDPIGFLRCRRDSKFLTPRQPKGLDVSEAAVIELLEGLNFEVALADLEGFSRIWLLWWFHQSQGWRPKVLPPRGHSGRKGLFATRSPHRPNPLGLTSVKLLAIEGHRLFIAENDLLDGTPILDIKPYIPEVDAYPDEETGWLGEMERELRQREPFEVVIEELARRQLDWLDRHHRPEFSRTVIEFLAEDPRPHRTRRIVSYDDGFRLSCGSWRVFFRREGERVVIERVASRYQEQAPEPHASFKDEFRS